MTPTPQTETMLEEAVAEPPAPLMDTDKIGEVVKRVREAVREEIRAALRDERRERWKKIHSVLAWIASQFKE